MKLSGCLRGALVAAVAWLPFGPVLAQSVAIVTDVVGRVESREAVAILSGIATDARLQIGEGGRLVVIYLRSGDEYSFTGPAQVQFHTAGPQVLTGAKPRKQASPLSRAGNPTIRPAEVARAGPIMRGTPQSSRIRLLAPSGTRILNVAPEFRWQEPEPQTTYRFELLDDSGKSLYETSVKRGALRLPPAIQLVEGARYTWELSARLSDGRRYVSAADFSVAAAQLRAEAESLRPAVGASVSDRVAYAAWLDQEELKDEARTYWKVLAAERPDDARLKALAEE